MAARLCIDLAALIVNYRKLAAAAERCGAVVKADAYGCGAGPVSRALASAGCEDFFVATAGEALALRTELPDGAIYCLEGALPETAAALAASGVLPVLNSAEQLAHWYPHRASPAAVHVDTGMARLGFVPEALEREQLAPFTIELLVSHLACADEPTSVMNGAQLARFAAVCARFPELPVSLGNAAATLAPELPVQGLARPGIALYGGAPFAYGGALEAVATFEAQVLQLRDLPTGTPVGYGASWLTPRPTRIAIVGAGYADGVRRSLSNRGQAIAGGRRVPIVGRVSMDLTALDVTDTAVAPGDWVEFFGPRLPLREVAALLGTIDYEVLTSVGPRVERCYRGGP